MNYHGKLKLSNQVALSIFRHRRIPLTTRTSIVNNPDSRPTPALSSPHPHPVQLTPTHQHNSNKNPHPCKCSGNITRAQIKCSILHQNIQHLSSKIEILKLTKKLSLKSWLCLSIKC